jgi:hypothetical protein
MEPFEEHAQETFAPETNVIHLVLFGMLNRIAAPYLAAIDRFLILHLGAPRCVELHWGLRMFLNQKHCFVLPP